MRMLFWFCGCLLACSVSGKELYINFDDYPEGSSPTNFHSALAGEGSPGRWQIVKTAVPSFLPPLTDKAIVDQHGVLAQTAEDMTDERFPMFIYDGEKFNDFKLSTRFKVVSGIAEQMAGMVFRFQDSSNFYVVRVSSLGRNVRFYKVVNGVRSDPIGPAMDVPAGTWHTLGIQCDGTQINIRLDDHLIMPTLNDNTFTDGKLGFWTKSDAVSYFADCMVDYVPRIAAAQQMVDTIIAKEPRILSLRIYTLQTNNTTKVIASEVPSEVGMAGTDAEIGAITNGGIFYGTERGAVLVTLPLRDRNGDYIAAIRVKLKSYITESQDGAVLRAGMVRKHLEDLCTSAEDLGK
jgi:hypothetical protein